MRRSREWATLRAQSEEQLERWLREPETILADVLAAQTPRRKRTDPLPMWHRLKLIESNRMRPIKRREAARKAAEERHKARGQARRMARGYTWPQRFIRAMEPGKWYGWKALGRSVDCGPSDASRVRQTCEARGWVERTVNPAWDGSTTGFAPGETIEPQWLYRLTAAGEAARAEIQ